MMHAERMAKAELLNETTSIRLYQQYNRKTSSEELDDAMEIAERVCNELVVNQDGSGISIEYVPQLTYSEIVKLVNGFIQSF